MKQENQLKGIAGKFYQSDQLMNPIGITYWKCLLEVIRNFGEASEK